MELSEIENTIVQLLADLKAPKMWMTANGVRKRLKTRHSVQLSKNQVFEILEGMEQKGNSIRHSNFPSQKTLDYLWGHTSVVKNRAVHEIHKTEVADEFFEGINDLENPPICFISHSHKDKDQVIALGKVLLQMDVYPWLAECEIEEGQRINHNIMEALDQSDFFILYLSLNALRSVWTRKEFEMHGLNFQSKVFLVVDSQEDDDAIQEDLIELLANWKGEGFRNAALCKGGSWNSKCDDFMYSLHEFMNHDSTIYSLRPDQLSGDYDLKLGAVKEIEFSS